VLLTTGPWTQNSAGTTLTIGDLNRERLLDSDWRRSVLALTRNYCLVEFFARHYADFLHRRWHTSRYRVLSRGPIPMHG
jgi:hypothetical protein